MYLRKQATVLISTIVILSLMSLLSCFMFKMMKNNNELGNLYEFDKDVYDLNKNDEQCLNKFMKQLNEDNEDKLNNLDSENNKGDIFSEDFEKKIDGCRLEYHIEDNKIFLISKIDEDLVRKREIKYIFKNKKIILVPTYEFEDYPE